MGEKLYEERDLELIGLWNSSDDSNSKDKQYVSLASGGRSMKGVIEAAKILKDKIISKTTRLEFIGEEFKDVLNSRLEEILCLVNIDRLEHNGVQIQDNKSKSDKIEPCVLQVNNISKTFDGWRITFTTEFYHFIPRFLYLSEHNPKMKKVKTLPCHKEFMYYIPTYNVTKDKIYNTTKTPFHVVDL